MPAPSSELMNLLETFIESAASEKKSFSRLDKKDIAKRQNSIIDFEHQIFKFLDRIFTNFPTWENKHKWLHFTRPDFGKSKQEYFKKYKDILKKNQTNSSPKLDAFLDKCFDIISRNGYFISLLDWWLKHETSPELTEEFWFKAKCHSNYLNPIKKENWIIDIWWVIKAHEDSKITIKNSTFTSWDKYLFIEEFETFSIKWDNMIFSKNNQTIPFNNFADDCIKTCTEILDEFKKII